MTERPKQVNKRREGRETKRHIPTEQELAFRVALGQRIRERRYPQFNQEEFADVIDVYRTHVSTIEQGRTDLRLSTLLRIANALGITPEELIQGIWVQPDLPEASEKQ